MPHLQNTFSYTLSDNNNKKKKKEKKEKEEKEEKEEKKKQFTLYVQNMCSGHCAVYNLHQHFTNLCNRDVQFN